MRKEHQTFESNAIRGDMGSAAVETKRGTGYTTGGLASAPNLITLRVSTRQGQYTVLS